MMVGWKMYFLLKVRPFFIGDMLGFWGVIGTILIIFHLHLGKSLEIAGVPFPLLFTTTIWCEVAIIC